MSGASLLMDPDVQQHLEEDGMPILVGVSTQKPYPARLVIAGIVLNQRMSKLGGLNMSHTCVTVIGQILSKESIEKILPRGASISAYDVGNGNTEFHIESADVEAALGFMNVTIEKTDQELIDMAKDALTKRELIDGLAAAGVTSNPFGTLINNNTSESELVHLANKAGILEEMMAEEEVVPDDSSDQTKADGDADDQSGDEGEAESPGADDAGTGEDAGEGAGGEGDGGSKDAEAAAAAPTDAVANDGADPVTEEVAPAAEDKQPEADDDKEGIAVV